MNSIQQFYNQLNQCEEFSKVDDKFFGKVDLSTKELILAKVTLFARGFLLALVLAFTMFPSAYMTIVRKNMPDDLLQKFYANNKDVFELIARNFNLTSFGIIELFYVEQLIFIRKYWRLINF